MSDQPPIREDLAIIERDQFDNLTGDWRYVTDAEFDAIAREAGYVPTTREISFATDLAIESLHKMMQDLEAEVENLTDWLREWERLGVKVWEDCPATHHPDPLDPMGDRCICDGSGKVLAEGVQEDPLECFGMPSSGYWIPRRLLPEETS